MSHTPKDCCVIKNNKKTVGVVPRPTTHTSIRSSPVSFTWQPFFLDSQSVKRPITIFCLIAPIHLPLTLTLIQPPHQTLRSAESRVIAGDAGARPAGGGLSKYWAKQLLSECHHLPEIQAGINHTRQLVPCCPPALVKQLRPAGEGAHKHKPADGGERRVSVLKEIRLIRVPITS